VTRPDLPATRDERIAIAAHAILGSCGPDDMTFEPVHRVLDAPVLVEFRVLTPSMPAAIALNHRAADAIMFGAGFAAISYSPPKQVSGGYVCAIRVPVGAP
jgi:hypothetical protein